MHRVVVISPSTYSLYTIGVTELLRRSNNVQVVGIVAVRLINPGRLRTEFRHVGRRLFSKVWKKVVLRGRGRIPGKAVFETLPVVLARHGITTRNIQTFRRRDGIPIVWCMSLNDPAVVDFLKSRQVDLVVFTGGGILRKDVLAAAGKGVVNCHKGILPRYRGMDVVEWPLLLGDFGSLGLTVHLMGEGVDTGPILRRLPIEILPGDSCRSIHLRLESLMCEVMVDTVVDFLNSKIRPENQRIADGKQFFIIHPKLAAIAERKLQSYLGSGPANST